MILEKPIWGNKKGYERYQNFPTWNYVVNGMAKNTNSICHVKINTQDSTHMTSSSLCQHTPTSTLHMCLIVDNFLKIFILTQRGLNEIIKCLPIINWYRFHCERKISKILFHQLWLTNFTNEILLSNPQLARSSLKVWTNLPLKFVFFNLRYICMENFETNYINLLMRLKS